MSLDVHFPESRLASAPKYTPLLFRLYSRGVILLCMFVMVPVNISLAQPPDSGPRPIQNVQDLGEEFQLTVGRSQVFRLPSSMDGVGVSDPTVADVQLIEPDQVMVLGLKVGETDFFVWHEDGTLWSTLLRVQLDLKRFNEDLRMLLPDCNLEAIRSGDIYMIHGELRRADQAEILQKFLGVRNAKFVNLSRLAGVQQVKIKVRVAEVNRTAIRNMTINAFKVSNDWFATSTIGSSAGAFVPMNIGVPGDTSASQDLPFQFLSSVGPNPLVTLLAGFPESDLELFIEALTEQQYVRVLAEPTLVALSGEEASFLAGGEYPIPVVRDTTGGGGTVSIDYKEFGVRLHMLPTVMGDGNIRLFVAPEVSELSDVGAIEIQGFRIPSLLTRRTETTVEMKSGQTFAMAGLLTSSNSARRSQIPVLGELPVLGPLFRSVNYINGESELVVLVTAELAEPLSLAAVPPLPGDLHVRPNNWELFLGGRLHGSLKALSDRDGASLNMEGLRDLQGPGPWASYYP